MHRRYRSAIAAMLALTCFVVASSLARAGSTFKWKENLALATALAHQINAAEPQYAIREANCRTITPTPAASLGVIPSQCLVISHTPQGGMYCGVLFVSATRPIEGLAFMVDHADSYSCGSVAKVLLKLKARGLVWSAFVA